MKKKTLIWVLALLSLSLFWSSIIETAFENQLLRGEIIPTLFESPAFQNQMEIMAVERLDPETLLVFFRVLVLEWVPILFFLGGAALLLLQIRMVYQKK